MRGGHPGRPQLLLRSPIRPPAGSLTERTPALLLAAAVPLTAATVTALFKASHFTLYADRHGIGITARPRPTCPQCRGEGGWWTGGAFPEMEVCGCWAHRLELRIRLLPIPAWDEPPF